MRYSNEPNPIRRAESQPPDPFDYEPRVAAVFGEMGNFANWTGTVRFSVENSQVYLAFTRIALVRHKPSICLQHISYRASSRMRRRQPLG